MAITEKKYVNILSAVGAANVVPQRQLILRLFTDNPLLSPQSYREFSSAELVGDFFGITSQEYLRALYYFSYISENVTTPQLISFGRYVDAAIEPRIYGVGPQVIGEYTGITAGSIGLTINGVVLALSALDFSTDANLAAVAARLQTAIRTGTGTMYTAATVTYNATNGGSFIFEGGSQVAATISVQAGVGGTDISQILGWFPGVKGTPNITVGSAIETPVQSFQESYDLSNNFGSFIFMQASPLSLSDSILVATANKVQNVMFMYSVAVSSSNYATYAAVDGTGLGLIGGVALTLSNIAGQYPEMFPTMIMAATDYGQVNSVQNYMFKVSPALTASVTTTALSDTLDAVRVNYYGQTQTAGTLINFYQRGVLLGLPTDPLDMNVYANEAWLKDAASSAIMTLLLTLSRISANSTGRAQLLTILQSVINAALFNGTISVGKPLTTAQLLYIAQITGSSKAGYQIQSIGYWVDCQIVLVPNVSPPQYKAEYTLVYSKDDIIRFVQGSHDLI